MSYVLDRGGGGGCVSPRADFDDVAKRKISAPTGEINPLSNFID
jgi:hypothetical protein